MDKILGRDFQREVGLSWVLREPKSFRTCVPGAGACSEHGWGPVNQRPSKNADTLVQL